MKTTYPYLHMQVQWVPVIVIPSVLTLSGIFYYSGQAIYLHLVMLAYFSQELTLGLQVDQVTSLNPSTYLYT